MGSVGQTRMFWAEITPCEHIAQFYEDDGALLDSLAKFVREGLTSGETSIVIATAEHIKALDERLNSSGVSAAICRLANEYITIEAQEALDEFMVNQWPDERLFSAFLEGLLDRAGTDGRRVRAFGEMVAILWASGNTAATIRLEQLWNNVCRKHGFPLFCAYPRLGSTKETEASIAEICAAHSRIF